MAGGIARPRSSFAFPPGAGAGAVLVLAGGSPPPPPPVPPPPPPPPMPTPPLPAAWAELGRPIRAAIPISAAIVARPSAALSVLGLASDV
ncbi:MAG: hypothetical protein GEU88_08025 [Solirubrobacterales bacterium]|nr:hypothetical protein [Solirubrobacterales bacterium]